VLLCRFIVRKEIDLESPRLGSELLKDPKGEFPLRIWESYCLRSIRTTLYPLPVLSWSAPDPKPFDPQAVDEAMRWAKHVRWLLVVRRGRRALECVERLIDTLTRGVSAAKRGRGQPPSIRRTAVRAWIIRKFNPHPTKPGESIVSWAKLADLLFLENRKCPRKIRDEDGTKTCGVSRHQYDSPCTKALMTAVRNLQSAMEHDGIPV
jgi:hypothetical protein